MQRINIPIRVGAIFAPGRPVQPVWFDWQKKQHRVQTITYRWQARRGEVDTLHFAVSDGQDLFELIYDTERRDWTLAGVEPGAQG